MDARHAVEQGATALGFVFWPKSPRFVSNRKVAEIVAALPASVMTVGVFVNESVDGIALNMKQTGLSAVQLHGDEPATYATALTWPIFRSVTLETADMVTEAWPAETTLLLDASDPVRRGGTGQQWIGRRPPASRSGAHRARRRADAGERGARDFHCQAVHGVDVSSGVEEAPGVKDADKVATFLARARKAMLDLSAGVRES